mmetsp:Transcript_17082/g.46292  ORF Transcript_17082/g.46292 Transcript_17082/m.46292 type:complete len:218 (+) Transcript_17082:65-718(+)
MDKRIRRSAGGSETLDGCVSVMALGVLQVQRRWHRSAVAVRGRGLPLGHLHNWGLQASAVPSLNWRCLDVLHLAAAASLNVRGLLPLLLGGRLTRAPGDSTGGDESEEDDEASGGEVHPEGVLQTALLQQWRHPNDCQVAKHVGALLEGPHHTHDLTLPVLRGVDCHEVRQGDAQETAVGLRRGDNANEPDFGHPQQAGAHALERGRQGDQEEEQPQ